MMSPCKTDGRNFELLGYSSLKRVSKGQLLIVFKNLRRG